MKKPETPLQVMDGITLFRWDKTEAYMTTMLIYHTASILDERQAADCKIWIPGVESLSKCETGRYNQPWFGSHISLKDMQQFNSLKG